ncbi:septum formation protein [Cyclospora cayetanensis]|uniref:Septum formation protein n=1 Tax=Cyclospora cayetanensis TaxID=88456 RepID=A0A1D3CZG9_9EIME|nr:septum formation protein [Cyclospora cayetanensis]
MAKEESKSLFATLQYLGRGQGETSETANLTSSGGCSCCGHPVVVMASRSPQRSRLFKQHLGVPVELRPSTAQGEAAAFAARMQQIVAADTVVDLEGSLLEQPRDAAEAREMLRLLQGNCHWVHTAVCIYTRAAYEQNQQRRVQQEQPPCQQTLRRGAAAAFVRSTRVEFKPLSDEDIEAYVASKEPLGKAGL